MRHLQSFSSIFVLLFLTVTVISEAVNKRQSNPYAPVTTTCPNSPLVRSAGSISDNERKYVTQRTNVACESLKKWLKKINPDFKSSNLPSIGLATSGGGFRSLLSGAGVIQSFDSRESNQTLGGLFQALIYHGGLSGGSLLVGSLAGNNWPTVTSLKTGLWETTLAGLPSESASAQFVADMAAKDAAGFVPTLVDALGRVLSFDVLLGPDGGVSETLSGVRSKGQFTAHAAPYPIITAIDTSPGQCLPDTTNPQFEMHPYEFGSWDKGIAAFSDIAFLGTNITNGKPTKSGVCIKNFDNLGYVMGASSDVFSATCEVLPSSNSSDPLIAAFEALLEPLHPGNFRDEFAAIPNPFYAYSGSPSVKSQPELTLVDGGLSFQNIPIWPFIQPARKNVIDVLIVNDNSANTDDFFPNGTEIYTTYQRAQQAGLSRMPKIPPPTTFVQKGLNKRATFFGCDDKDKLTIICLPNVPYVFPSGTSDFQMAYTAAETDGMIANGVQIGTQNGDSQWPTCFACAIMKKTSGPLPKACTACFSKYCY